MNHIGLNHCIKLNVAVVEIGDKIMINYNIRNWLTTGIISPFIVVAVDYVFGFDNMQHQMTGKIGFIFFSIILGLIFSVPALIFVCHFVLIAGRILIFQNLFAMLTYPA